MPARDAVNLKNECEFQLGECCLQKHHRSLRAEVHLMGC